MFWLITSAVLLLILISLLIAPIFVRIDTRANQYSFWLPGLINVNFEGDKKEIVKARVALLFVKFYIYPLNYIGKSKRSKTRKPTRKKQSKHVWFKRFLGVVRTFKVKQCYVNMDTGDVLLNARLYPLFALLNYNGGNFHINFDGQNQYVLLIKNRPINIIKSFINP